MLKAVVVVGKGTAGVIRWIDEYTLYRTCKLLFQRLQCQKIVTKNQAIVEYIGI